MEDVLKIFLPVVLLQREDVEFVIIYCFVALCVVMHREEGGEKGCVDLELKGSTLGCYQSCWCAAWAGGPRAVLEIPPEINCS